MTPPSFQCKALIPGGNSLDAVFTGLKQKQIFATSVPHLLSPGKRSGSLVPIQLGIIADLPLTQTPSERMLVLLQQTLIPLLAEQMHEQVTSCFITIVLPDKKSTRYTPHLVEIIEKLILAQTRYLSTEKQPNIEYIHENEPLMHSFLSGQAKLHRGECERFIFGGVDSFINIRAIRDFEKNHGSIRKEGNADAPLLGEGAVFIALSAQSPVLALISPIQESLLTKGPAYWLTNRSPRLRTTFEWFSCIQKHSDLEQLTELDIQKWIGHLGAALFPLQMALGFFLMIRHTIGSEINVVLYDDKNTEQIHLQRYHRYQQSSTDPA